MIGKIKTYWQTIFQNQRTEEQWPLRLALYKARKVTIRKLAIRIEIYRIFQNLEGIEIEYKLHIESLLQQKRKIYIEECTSTYRVYVEAGELTDEHRYIRMIEKSNPVQIEKELKRPEATRNSYNRLEAVRYAQRYWNDYNPEFPVFHVDCTNYISQCLLAGGCQMTGFKHRGEGWWYTGPKERWSYSWAVAHALRWYLAGDQVGIRAEEKQSARDLSLGDIICYDFEGDGRWDHTTIVVQKDAYGEPLVNAHTNNSRHRYWSYEDSAAWTEQCEYKYFHILDS